MHGNQCFFPSIFRQTECWCFSDLDHEITDSWISNVEGLHLSDSAMYSSIFGMILSKHGSCFWLKCLGRWVGYRYMCMCIIVYIYISPLPFPPQNGRGWGAYKAPFCGKWFLKMGSNLPFCSNLWVLPGFIIFILKAWSFMGTKTNHFVTNKKPFCWCF